MKPDASETEKDWCGREADRIQRFFRRPSFLSLTIGIPFCTYKLLLGTTAVRIGSAGNVPLTYFGWLIIGWAGLDLVMNLSRVVFDLSGRPARFECCTIAQLGRFFRAPWPFSRSIRSCPLRSSVLCSGRAGLGCSLLSGPCCGMQRPP